MSEFWFTYTQEEYEEKFLWIRRFLKKSGEKKQWTYHHCTVQLIGTENKKTRLVLRRVNSKKSKVMKFKYTVNLMVGFVVDKANEPTLEKIKYKKETFDAWVINFDVKELKNPELLLRPISNVKVWIKKEDDVEQVKIKKLFTDIIMQRPVKNFLNQVLRQIQRYCQ